MTLEELAIWLQKKQVEFEALPEEEKERRRAKLDTGLAERMGSYEQVKSDDSPTK